MAEIKQEETVTQEEMEQAGYVGIPVTYYPINEDMARRAKEMNSFFDYQPGSATKEYFHCLKHAFKIAVNPFPVSTCGNAMFSAFATFIIHITFTFSYSLCFP